MERTARQYVLSVVVAAAIGAEPWRCWRNAVLAILSFPELFAQGTYVEGWVVIPRTHTIVIVEHGWCTSPLVGTVDPSLVLLEPQEQLVYYFPGYELAGATLEAHVAGKTVPRVCNAGYGSDGMGHPGYKRSYEQAWQKVRACAHALHLPPSAITVSRRDARRGMTIVTRV